MFSLRSGSSLVAAISTGRENIAIIARSGRVWGSRRMGAASGRNGRNLVAIQQINIPVSGPFFLEYF